MYRIIKGFLFFTLIFCTGYSTIERDCMDLFHTAFGKMGGLNPQPGKGLSLKYTISVQTADNKTYDDEMDLTIFNSRSKIISNDVTVYQDEKATVAIRNESNAIFIARPEEEALRKTKFLDILKIQDSIFSKMILKSCVNETSGYKKMTFEFPSKVVTRTGINSAMYWVDEKSVSIKKLKLNYAQKEGQPLQSWTMDFIYVNAKYTGLPFSGSAVSQVYESGKKLKSVYKNFTVMDKR